MTPELFQEMSSSPEAFRKNLLIDADGSVVPFQPDPWQEQDFKALDAGWKVACGLARNRRGIVRRGWLERPRGHSKTHDLAVPATWALLFARRPVKGIAAAADRDQAGLLKDAITTILRYNPSWMAEALDVQSWSVVNRRNGSQLEILSSDVATSYGQLPDFVVIDELTHWKSEDLWVSLFSAAAKRSGCVMVCGMNAGFRNDESWQWKVREQVREDPAWYFNHLDGCKASWITPDRLEEQRRLLPGIAFDRLWGNLWASGSGDALSDADIQAAITQLQPMLAPEAGWAFYAGLDLGISRDRCGLVLIGKNYETQRLRLCQAKSWAPPRGGKIDLLNVQEDILRMNDVFHPLFFFDPYQSELLGQQLIEKGVRLELVPFAGKSLMEMASNLLEVFNNHAIDLFRHEELLADLRKLRVKETPAGWRLDAPRTAAGHADLATGLSLAILASKRFWFGNPNPDTSDVQLIYTEDPPKQAAKHGERPSTLREAMADLGIGFGVDDDWGDAGDPWRGVDRRGPWRR